VPLQGTFDTLPLAEVLHLLAGGGKTGTLRLDAGAVSGRVYLTGGRCCGAESGDLAGPVESGDALGARFVDVCFTVARQDGGSFLFADGEAAPWPTPHEVVVTDAVLEVERLLGEWRDIQTVIPSLETTLRLRAELGAERIEVDRARWAMLRAVGDGRSVRDVIQQTGGRVLDVCHGLRDLVDLGALERTDEPEPVLASAPTAMPEPTVLPEPTLVDRPPATSAPGAGSIGAGVVAAPASMLSPPGPLPVAPYGPGVDDQDEPRASEAEDDSGALDAPLPSLRTARPEGSSPTRPDLGSEDDIDDESQDRGALLRLFTALREG
jgi:hypothetical protein